jgi:hypothetical protein
MKRYGYYLSAITYLSLGGFLGALVGAAIWVTIPILFFNLHLFDHPGGKPILAGLAPWLTLGVTIGCPIGLIIGFVGLASGWFKRPYMRTMIATAIATAVLSPVIGGTIVYVVVKNGHP